MIETEKKRKLLLPKFSLYHKSTSLQTLEKKKRVMIYRTLYSYEPRTETRINTNKDNQSDKAMLFLW